MSSFTLRLTLRFAALVTVTTATVLAIGGWLLDRQMLRSLELLHGIELAEFAEIIGEAKARGLTEEQLQREFQEEAEKDTALYFFQVSNERGELIFRSPNLGATILPDLSLQAPHWTAEVAGVGPVRISEFRAPTWHLQVGSPLGPSRRLLSDYARVAGVLVLGVAIAGVGLGYGFSRYTLRPVRAIEQTARRIRADNLGERIPQPEGRDELADLVRLLNQMFDRLETSFSEVRRFTADASHELKTPLALVRLNAEKLRTRLAADPDASEPLDELMEDLDSLRRIIDSLLFLAKTESGSFAPAQQEIAADEFVRDFALDAAAMTEERGVNFTVTQADAGRIRCEPTLMRQLLLNLVSNAVRVVPAGGGIRLASQLAEGRWRLVVTDDGPGLAEEQLARIFERFVRFGAAGSTDGHGLGLAICRSIARLHGGEIVARNRRDRPGLAVTVELPAG